MNKYIIVITALLFIASNTFFYFKGKDTGIEQQLKKDEVLRQEQEEFHRDKIQKLNESLKTDPNVTVLQEYVDLYGLVYDVQRAPRLELAPYEGSLLLDSVKLKKSIS